MSSWVREDADFRLHEESSGGAMKGGNGDRMVEVVSPTSSSSSNGSHDLYAEGGGPKAGATAGDVEVEIETEAETETETETASTSAPSSRGAKTPTVRLSRSINSSTRQEEAEAEADELQFGEMEDEDYHEVNSSRLVLPLDGESEWHAGGMNMNSSMLGSTTARKASSSFSDLGDYDDCACGDVTPTGTTPSTPLRSPYEGTMWGRRSGYSGMSNGHYVGAAASASAPRTGSWRSSGRTTPTPRCGVLMDEHQAIGGGVFPVAGEVLRAEVEHAAFIIFYKGDDTESEQVGGRLEASDEYGVTSCSEEGENEADESEIATAFCRPPRCFASLETAGYSVQATNCFTREYAHPTKSLGRGLFRASTHVGSAFLKGATGLVNQTYQGGANGGVFGFAKGLGMGMLGLGTHAVKGAVRGVGQVTNLVGEMVMGTGPHFSVDGRLVLTNYRIVWVSLTTQDTIEVPLASIQTIETSAIAPHIINIECKNLLRACFAFRDELTSRDFLSSANDLYSAPCYVFAHTHFETLVTRSDPPHDSRSFSVFHAEEDYRRLRLLDEDSWMRLLDNSSYQLCPSYPASFVVPSELDDDDLRELSSYRSASRIPAVVWRHPHSGAMMARCAQPCAGLGGRVADADRKYVAALQRATSLNGGCLDATFHFYDARSQIAATANSAQGKGTEDPRNYPNTELHFCEIANIHAVRSSFAALSVVCQPGDDRYTGDWFFQLRNTLWFTHLARILSSAQEICETLCLGSSLMVHCSDGWDRTPQLVALIEYLLDPQYRTLEGFLALVEKEWCSFGHMFRARYSHGEAPGQQELEEQSPVFVQWLDALWQVWRQETWAFEFNEALLTVLYDHVYSGLTGAFLYNNEKECQQRETEAPTRSLWEMLLDKKDEFVNAEYDAIKNFYSVGIVLPFSAEEEDLVLWDHHLVYCDPICHKYC